MAQCLLLTTPNLVLGWHTFVPEDFGVPGQQGLEKHWHVTLGLIIPQVVLQLSGKQAKVQFTVILQAIAARRLECSFQ